MNSRVPSRTPCSILETVPACPLPQKDWATLLHTCHRHRYLLVTKHFATKHLLPLFQCLQKLPCWNLLVISFCSSLGSTFLLIERTTIEPRALAGHQYHQEHFVYYKRPSWHYKKYANFWPSILVTERSLFFICDLFVTKNRWSKADRL
jgi:hypothetical protein